MNPHQNMTESDRQSQSFALSALMLLAHFHDVAINPVDIAHRFMSGTVE